MANTYMTITMMVRTMPVNPEINRKKSDEFWVLTHVRNQSGGGGRSPDTSLGFLYVSVEIQVRPP